MKPGNLFMQGAKSGGRRKMRIRQSASNLRWAHFFVRIFDRIYF